MAALRDPQTGCPWDIEQDFSSIAPYTIEEAYEVADAIERGDLDALRGELGDLLLQVVFHSELAQEDGVFDMDDVARGISEKLIRRHPHVFGESGVDGSEAVLKQWDEIKRVEKGDEEKPYLHGVGKGLPSLLKASKLQKKASKVGFDWPDQAGVLAKIREEVDELAAEMESGDDAAFEEELGDLLFSVVNLARFRKIDPEVLLAAANVKFEDRFAKMEAALKAKGSTLESASVDEMEAEWQAAKGA